MDEDGISDAPYCADRLHRNDCVRYPYGISLHHFHLYNLRFTMANEEGKQCEQYQVKNNDYNLTHLHTPFVQGNTGNPCAPPRYDQTHPHSGILP